VVDLVLDKAGQAALVDGGYRDTVEGCGLHGNSQRARHLPAHVEEGQAPFVLLIALLRHIRDTGVEEDYGAGAGLGRLDDSSSTGNTDLRRGGLKGLPEAVETVWPRTIVQTCVVHLLRNSFRYAARQDWEKIAKLLKPVYTAPTEEAALLPCCCGT
jgi:hypothetical protein